MIHKKLLLTVAAMGCTGVLSGVAWSQGQGGSGAAASADSADTLQEVVVTAERRSSDLEKTAVSVAVRSGEDMIQEGKSSLAQILEDVPGVIATPVLIAGNSDNPGAGIVIRGVAPDNEPPGDTSVATTAIYTDGVYGGIGGDVDISRVEVLRGPQGTLYGRSATSGVISTYTHDPVLGKWGADASLEYGSYALQHVSGEVNLPVNDQLAVRVSGMDLYQNGYLGGHTGGSHDEGVGRVKVLYQPNADFSLLVGLAVQADLVDSGGPAATLAAPNAKGETPLVITQSSTYDEVTDMQRQAWAQLNWNLGFGTLTYIPAIRTFTSDSPSLLNFPPIFVQDTTNNYPIDQTHTEELRLASNSELPVSWIAGAWYYNRKYVYNQDVYWEPSGGYSHGPHTNKDTTNDAAFGELTYPFATGWRATAGLRFDHTLIDSQGSTYAYNLNQGACTAPCTLGAMDPTFSLPDNVETFSLPAGDGIHSQNNVTYKARVEHDLTPTSLLYAMVSTGFLPADVSVANQGSGASTTVVAFNYKAETLTSYELGSKSRLLNNRLQLNGALYYYDYSGYQRFVNIGIGPSPDLVEMTSPAQMLGAEWEALWLVTPSDRIGFSGGYVDARYVNKPALFAQYVAQTRIPGVAPLTLQARYDHYFRLWKGSTLDVGADGLFTSAYDQSAVAPAYAAQFEPYVHDGSEFVANARLTWTSASGKYFVTGYVRNLTNNIYKTAATTNGFLPGGGVSTSVVPSAPRVFGVVLNASL